MTDTQWPGYQVFHQERPGQPHTNAGAVHAPDAELALQNARDVFVRRPDCASLWVAPADQIFSRTAEEIERAALDSTPAERDRPVQRYQVFVKRSQAGSQEHQGEVEGQSPEAALTKAVQRFGTEGALVWWVVPEESIERTDPAEAGTLFGPAKAKSYRDQASYPTATLMRRVRDRQGTSP